MQATDTLSVQQSLIMVFAHLMHSKMDAVLLFLSNLPGPTGRPGLEFLMTEWVSKSTMFAGMYECKVSLLALAKILEHAISTEDQRFQGVVVRGDRIINPVEGIRTRSKVKNEKELFTQVPLLVKIYKLLINELHGLLEEKKDFNGEDEDEGECEENLGDYDDDENEAEEDDGNGIEVDENGSETENINSYLNKYDAFDEAFERDEDQEDPEALEDPLNNIDLLVSFNSFYCYLFSFFLTKLWFALKEYITQYLRNLSQHPCYSVFSEHHNQLEKEVLKEIGVENA